MTDGRGTVPNGTAHPSYPNPTIAEALCEIHFRLPTGVSWKPSFVGEFFKAVQPEFPEMEPVQELGFEVELGEGGVSQRMLPPRARIRFKHRARPLLLQLMENVLTVNLLPKYPGWERMRQDILEAWGRAREVLQPRCISRIGLRYINRVIRGAEDERPGVWLRGTASIPAGVLTSATGFLSRVDIRLDTENRRVVTLGDQIAGKDSPFGAIILDIDRIIQRESEPTDEALRRDTDRLHEDVWGEFHGAQGDRMRAVLNEKRA